MAVVAALGHHLQQNAEFLLRDIPALQIDRAVGEKTLVAVALVELGLGALQAVVRFFGAGRLRIHGFEIENRLLERGDRAEEIAVLDVAVLPLCAAEPVGFFGKFDQLLARILNRPDSELILGERLKLLADRLERLGFTGVDDALIDGLQQNQEFFSMLLNDESLKKEVLGIFIKSIYEDLKNDEE